jgi:hypothetical protein
MPKTAKARTELRVFHPNEEAVMGKMDSEYPTNEQIEETLEAYRKGGDALVELIRRRRAADADDGQYNEQADSRPSDS